ncbi:MAG: hypothetical protein QXL57_04690 [Candidatus Bathyarchaeia archaeon]
MYEFTAIFLLALLFIIVYFIGMRQNRKIAVKYARTVKEYMSPKSEFVGFRPYSRGGFRAVCKMKEKEAFKQIEMAVSLVDRENLMHYPLTLLTKDTDRLACWGFLKDPLSLSMEILSKPNEKIRKKMATEKNLKEITVNNTLNSSFTILTSDQKSAKRFLSYTKLEKCLMETKDFVKRLSLDSKDSRIYLIGDLRDESTIKSLFDILLCCGEQSRKIH